MAEKMNNPLELMKKYDSVADMVRDLSEDKEASERTIRKIGSRNILDFLMAIRSSKEMSQSDIAKAMRCTQSKVSKLESGKDNNLAIGDFHAYASALGLHMSIMLAGECQHCTDEPAGDQPTAVIGESY